MVVKQGFRHCDLWRAERFGDSPDQVVWLRLRPTFEILECFLEFDPTPPWVKHPDAYRAEKWQVLLEGKLTRSRQWWTCRPPSCVETCKNALGIKAFWVYTPYQLYRYIGET